MIRLRQVQHIDENVESTFSCCVSSCGKLNNVTFWTTFLHLYSVQKVGPPRIPFHSFNRTRVHNQSGVLPGACIWRFFGVKKVDDSLILHSIITVQLSEQNANDFLTRQHEARRIAFDNIGAYLTVSDRNKIVNLKHVVDVKNMEESLLKYTILDVSLLFGKPIKIGNGAPTVTLTRQLILALINGDMKCIYTLMGHSAQFACDKYRCIFCYHNWETGESGADREIEDFESLCECHNLNPTDASLNFNIVQKPLIKLQTLAVIVPFFLHVFLGLFQRSMVTIRHECQTIDSTIPSDVRDPDLLQRLQQKLDFAIVQHATSVQNKEQAELLLESANEEFVDLCNRLNEVHDFWWYKNSVQTVANRNQLSAEQLQGYIQLREEGLASRLKLDSGKKEVVVQKKFNKLSSMHAQIK